MFGLTHQVGRDDCRVSAMQSDADLGKPGLGPVELQDGDTIKLSDLTLHFQIKDAC